MTGSSTCDGVALAQTAADEYYYTQRLKQALDAPNPNTKISGINAPEHWTDTSIHTANLNVGVDKSSIVSYMNSREALVQTCVNELISYQELDNAQTATAQGTESAPKVAEDQRQEAIRSYNNMLSDRDSKARIVEVNTYYSKAVSYTHLTLQTILLV